MLTVDVTTDATTTIVTAPYHPDWSSPARKLGGDFQGKTRDKRGVWHFDVRDDQRVRDLCRRVYGTDGSPTDLVTARITLDEFYFEQSVWQLGRKIAERPSKNERVFLGEGVALIAGHLDDSGGSHKNPRLEPDEGTVVEVRDVPAQHPQVINPPGWLTIVATGHDPQALRAEREQLLRRVGEIDALLEGTGSEQAN